MIEGHFARPAYLMRWRINKKGGRRNFFARAPLCHASQHVLLHRIEDSAILQIIKQKAINSNQEVPHTPTIFFFNDRKTKIPLIP